MITLGKLNGLLLQIFPANWAFDWDNVGLIVGNPVQQISKILLALELTDKIIQEAVKIRAGAIITHHPPYIKPPSTLLYSQTTGRYFFELIKNNIGHIALHTNVDVSPKGTNHFIAEKLKLDEISFLSSQIKEKLFKYAVFVPVSHVEAIINAIHKSGGGWIGNYSHCTFRTEGTGTFMPLEGTNPYIGKTGVIENVQEHKVETIVPAEHLNSLVSEVKKTHPYEEPAYDIYPLNQSITNAGLGVSGILKNAETINDIIQKLKDVLNTKTIGIVVKNKADLKKKIRKIAICTGAGGNIIRTLSPDFADLYITGEAGYHDILEAREKGLNVAVAGHFATEAIFTKLMKRELNSLKDISDNKIEIYESRKMEDPMNYI